MFEFIARKRWLTCPIRFFRVGYRLDLLGIGLIFVLVFPYSARLNNPNERTRVLQAWSIVEHGQLHIGEALRDRRNRIRFKDTHGRLHSRPFVNDIALVCDDPSKEPPRCVGKLYPAKPPGATLLGVPSLWLARALRFIEDPPVGEAGVTPAQMSRAQRDWERVVEAKATWILRYGGVAIPLLLALLAFCALLRRAGLSPGFTRFCLWTTAFGTAVFPYGVSFVGHALAGAALLASLSLLMAAHERSRPFVAATAAGLIAGWAVLLEYQAIVPLLAICGWVLFTRRGRGTLPAFALGSGAALAVFAWIHNAMFLSPFKTGHFFLVTTHNREGQSSGFLGVDGLHLGSLRDHLFDTYMGLAPLMPWLFVGFFAGCIALLRRQNSALALGTRRALVAMPLLSLLFVTTLGNWRVMNGWSIGPRYLLAAMIPMAAVASLGWAWLLGKHRFFVPLCGGLALASILIIGAMTITYPSPTNALLNPFGELSLPLLFEGVGVRNILMSLGPTSIWLLGGLLAAMALGVLAALLREAWPKRPRLTLIAGLTIGLGWVGALSDHSPTEPKIVIEKKAKSIRAVEGVGPGAGENSFFPQYD